MQRGFSMMATLAFSFVFLVLLLIVLATTQRNRHRLSQHKHQQAAYWLAVSGADLLEARLSKGNINTSQTLSSGELRDGEFEAHLEGAGTIVSRGKSADQVFLLRRKLGSSPR